jgi:ABC-type polysaccharide/polyol phosphate export permease
VADICKLLKRNLALNDIVEALRQYQIFISLGLQDVLTRYRRSRVGAFWLTINMVVMIGVLGFVFANLFRAPISNFLPSLSVGIVVWGFLSGLVADGCLSFVSASETILQVKMPLTIHVLRVAWRNIIIFMHNLIIVPVVFFYFSKDVSWVAILSLVGFIFVVLNAVWIMLILATICTRFRDLTQIIQNAMQVIFYATPIIWSIDMLPDRYEKSIVNVNPFYHMLNLIREPLLGNVPSMETWIFIIIMTIIGWSFSLFFFSRYYKRVAYWL